MKCKWCGCELIKDFGPVAYFKKAIGTNKNECYCPSCARQLNIKHLSKRIETNNLQDDN